MRTRALLLASAFLLTTCLPALAADPDWTQYRGPSLTGTSLGNELLDREAVGLELAWKRDLGSGYSSISVAGDVGVTMFADGSHDCLVAFDAITGEERWRYQIADMYEGHSGSDDGPISTPAIADGTVYGVGPRGQIAALDLESGKELWKHTLSEEEAKSPHYGFATAPLVVDDLLVVQTGGGGGHSISAYERKNGKLRWSVEDDPVNYQSPAAFELGGRRQIVAANDKYLLGLAPENGEVLWKHEHKTQALEAFTSPLTMGEDRILITSLAETAAFAVKAENGGFAVEELWRNEGFKNTYAVPVYHEGHLYGYSNRFLTCLDAATGEVVWRSRPPGGRGLILVDGQLVMLGRDGSLVVAAASPAGYEERTRLAVFERDGWTSPSFAAGRIYVRNLEQMAAVEITDQVMPKVAEKKERVLLGEFGKFVERVEAADDKDALVDEYFADHETFPILEGDDGLVHFIYRGETKDIAISGNFLEFRAEEVMDRIAGTDVFFKSYEVDPEAIYEYRFSVDFGTPKTDPANPETTLSFLGPHSVLFGARAGKPDFFGESDAPEGRLDAFQWKSDLNDTSRRVRVYLPANYSEDGDARFPLLVVLRGGVAVRDAEMNRVFDNLIAAGRTAPFIAAFIPRVRGVSEFQGPAVADFARLLTEELIPHIDKHYRTSGEPASRTIMGVIDGGVGALTLALAAPGQFGQVVMQSAFARPPVPEDVLETITEAEKQELRVYAELRRADLKIGDNLDSTVTTKSLIEALGEAGYDVETSEIAGSWGWASWMSRLDEILGGTYPPPAAD